MNESVKHVAEGLKGAMLRQPVTVILTLMLGVVFAIFMYAMGLIIENDRMKAEQLHTLIHACLEAVDDTE